MPNSTASDSSSEPDAHSELNIEDVDADKAIAGSPDAYYEANLSMHPALDDEGDVEVDGCQGDLSMCPSTDNEDEEVDLDDLSMHAIDNKGDKLDGSMADVYGEEIDAGARYPLMLTISRTTY